MGRNKNKNKIRGNKSQQDNEAGGESQAHSRTFSNTATSYSSATGALTSKTPQLDGCSTPQTQLSKRDSVISSPWEEPMHILEPRLEPIRRPWWRRTICSWWPCRFVRWVHTVVTAFTRAFQGPQRRDLFMTFCLAATCIFASYIAVELICKMIQIVSAQNADANCSVIFVTIPGPIITVSLIAAAPSIPGHGTYYFSMVYGTTQWLHSIAPPDQTSVLDVPPPSTLTSSTGPSTTQSSDALALSSTTVNLPFPSQGIVSTTEKASNLSSETLILSTISPGGELTSVIPPTPYLVPAPLAPLPSTYSPAIGGSSIPWPSPVLIIQSSNLFSSPSFSNNEPFKNPVMASPSVTALSSSVLGRLTASLSNNWTMITSYTTSAGTSLVLESTTIVLKTNSSITMPKISAISKSNSLPTPVSRALLSTSSTLPQAFVITISKTVTSMITNKISSAITKVSLNISSSTVLASSPSLSHSKSLGRRTLLFASASIMATKITPGPLTSTTSMASIFTVTLGSSLTATAMSLIADSGPSIVPRSVVLLPSSSSTLNSTPLRALDFNSNWTPVTGLDQLPEPSSNANDENQLHARNLATKITKVISYGDAAIRFIFPPRDIITTESYWTGVYPTVTGPLPSELQSLLLTTRSVRQTPLSVIPSFQLVSSGSGSSETVSTPSLEENELAPTTISIAGAEPEPEPAPTLCGESGNFTLTFDDMVINENRNQLVATNMKAPYHHLFYANGLVSVPDKWEPYPAISQPNIVMFLPLSGQILAKTPFAGTLLPGELGAGPRASVNAYWFNAYSAYFGCALNGLVACSLRISGYRYDAILKEEVLVVVQNVTIPACLGYINCRLRQVFFNDEFQALSGIQFNAYTSTLGIPQVHMMDDLQMEWYNNSCSAGILRLGHR